MEGGGVSQNWVGGRGSLLPFLGGTAADINSYVVGSKSP